MLQLDREPAFILKRFPYKENQYLLDLFTLNHGKLRAIARITKSKTHRETETLAPFRELRISGQQKNELANLWQSETINIYHINGKDWLSASYLNELLLLYAAPEADSQLYQLYQRSLQQLDHTHLRQIEWHLICELGLIPERDTSAPYYQIHKQNGWLLLQAAKQGFSHELIYALETNELPLQHPQLKTYLQALLQQHNNTLRSKQTAHTLMQLIRS